MEHLSSLFSSGLLTESRSVMRGLVRKPGYAIAAWVMLGLAIAANAVVFAIVYGYMLKPLPYSQPSQLSVVRERMMKTGDGINSALVSVNHYLSMKKELASIADTGLATQPDAQPVSIGNRTHFLIYDQVTPSLFQTLGVQPVLGRLPAANANQPGGPPEAVISARLWKNAYGGNKDVLDRSLKVNNKTYQIVGVMPANFFYRTGDIGVWLPYAITPERAKINLDINYSMVVRRKPGVSLRRFNLNLQHQREMLLNKTDPAQRAHMTEGGYTLDAQPLRVAELNLFGIGNVPWLLQAAAGLLLLLALANTLNLGLVRQHARQHEFALRRVLGARRNGLAGLILVEHLPVAFVAGVTATLLAGAGIAALHAFGVRPFLSPFDVTLAPPVIAFTWGLTILAVLAVACGPTLLATGRKLLSVLGHGPIASGGKGPRRIQRTLGVMQIGLACALVIGSGLLGISLWKILSQPIGFTPEHRVEAVIFLPHDAQNTTAWASLEPQLKKLPGVSSVAASGMTPFSRIGESHATIQKSDAEKNAKSINVNKPSVSAGFFSTLGIKFLSGRTFAAAEMKNQARPVIINAWLAKHLFGSADKAVGQNLTMWMGSVHIIGVTHDIAWQPTREQYKRGTVYVPFGANQQDLLVVLLKTHGPLGPTMNALRNTIKATLPESAVYKMSSLENIVRGASIFRSAGAVIVGAFAALALLLAALGVFAITAFIARSRLGEYGIRAALGAGPSALLRLGFREATWLLLIGLPIGLGGAYLLGRVIANALYQTPVFDVGLYALSIVIITAVVFTAAWGPARRATHTQIRNLIGGENSK